MDNDWIKDAFNKVTDSMNKLGPEVFGVEDTEQMYRRSIEESAMVMAAWVGIDPKFNRYLRLSMVDDDFVMLLSTMWACGYAAGRSDALGEGDE